MTLTRKNKALVFAALAAVMIIMTTFSINAAQVSRQVFTFSQNPELKLTRYVDSTATAKDTPLPCIIFAFGGGFTHGERDDVRYEPYFNFMARQGYVVCSIDYRTTMAGFKPGTGQSALLDYGKALANAIQTATTDFLTATGYVIANAANWNIDPTKVVASGSSAGAITALQAEYTLVNSRPAGFPANFNYAALVTFAGAVFTQGTPQNLNHFCPALLFHADADMQVPYSSLVLGPVGLYGSKYLATQFKDAGLSGAFWTELGTGHEMALTPMTQNLFTIAGFLHRVLDTDRKAYDWTTVTVPGRPADYKTDFTIMDYIRGNM
ncbi:MAG: alpha/beta hydrolase [Firmicutes bacterium]|nr:alpha/beta hydrolase [Bacillota bacterium]MCM1400708.1 alpha/beta hydrolase [Bacteroides sp.]MCM1476402.1 alpha/beta hydrolase [Bacteroides sp.]